MKKTPGAHNPADHEGRHVYVRGMVQGVYFRQFTKDQAIALGLTGWVQNLPDGRVELKAFGAADSLNTLLKKLQQGPPAAKVTELNTTAIPLEIFSTFHINR